MQVAAKRSGANLLTKENIPNLVRNRKLAMWAYEKFMDKEIYSDAETLLVELLDFDMKNRLAGGIKDDYLVLEKFYKKTKQNEKLEHTLKVSFAIGNFDIYQRAKRFLQKKNGWKAYYYEVKPTLKKVYDDRQFAKILYEEDDLGDLLLLTQEYPRLLESKLKKNVEYLSR